MDWGNLTWWWCMAYFGFTSELSGKDLADPSRANFNTSLK